MHMTRKSSKALPSLRTSCCVLAVRAALIAFGVIPAMGDWFDGGTLESQALAQEHSAPDVGASKESSFKLGGMAAFVMKETPEPLPDVTFQDASGKDVTLSSFKGKTILLNLWATWCTPCREEMPGLDRLQLAFGKGRFELIALSIDRKGYEVSRNFLREIKANEVALYTDVTAISRMELNLIGMPTTILINKDGLEVGRLAGSANWDSDDAKKLIEATIN